MMTRRVDAIREGDRIRLSPKRAWWTVAEVRDMGSVHIFLTVRTPMRQQVISLPRSSAVEVER